MLIRNFDYFTKSIERDKSNFLQIVSFFCISGSSKCSRLVERPISTSLLWISKLVSNDVGWYLGFLSVMLVSKVVESPLDFYLSMDNANFSHVELLRIFSKSGASYTRWTIGVSARAFISFRDLGLISGIVLTS